VGQEDVLIREEKFHDKWAESINIDDIMVAESFEACTAPENRLILQRLGDIKGKNILELGSGLGEASVYFAKLGARVTATDLSSGMLKTVKKLAEKHRVELEAVQCSSHHLPFKDDSFDIVYAANLLHHVDIESTLIEVRRVLKNNGIFVSWDPLGHNPIINIYRRMASRVRTEDEHPIMMRDLKLFRKYYSKVELETTWFFPLLIFIKFYLIDRIHPNNERYWKKILLEHRELEKMYNFLEYLDKGFLRIFPFFRKYCWNIVIFSSK